MSELLRAERLYKSYHDGTRELKVLQGASLTVARGEAVAVVGMSGAGKSTLLHLLGGLDTPDAGELLFEGKSITSQPLSRLHDFRNHAIGFVFQFHHLLPEFSAVENIIIPAMMSGRRRREIEPEALTTLERLGLADRARHRPSKLSGGEQQRVALARALVNQPALLLADEPTGNLDIHTGEAVIQLMWEMTVRQNRGLVIVTHEPLIAARADRILRLFEGRLIPLAHEDLEELMAKGKN
ncbi:MAG: ABC transporter ATP-binding protein [bacterium]|nr:ABC transporter ATP-binding protein [bacterium]